MPKFKTGVIMGDLNINLLNYFFNGIFLLVNLPAIRICTSSAKLIDHINRNHIASSFLSSIVTSDLAHHFGTYLSIVNDHNINLESTINSRCLSNKNIISFRVSLSTIDF